MKRIERMTQPPVSFKEEAKMVFCIIKILELIISKERRFDVTNSSIIEQLKL